MNDEVVAITVTAKQQQTLAAIIDELRDYGCGWVILDELAIAIYNALPAEVSA